MNAVVNRRKARRVTFAHGIDVQIFAIDGTWRRPCMMLDVSETGVRLVLKSSLEGLNLKEFFLVLSSTGLAFRRCQLAWINGEEIGAHFLDEAGGSRLKRPKEEAGAFI
ncbi:MAG: PilZ domain-containing protein [Bradyrhizobium sp.]